MKLRHLPGMNKGQQPSYEDRLKATLHFLEKLTDHAAKAYGTAQTTKDRDLAKELLTSLDAKIIELRAQIKAVEHSE